MYHIWPHVNLDKRAEHRRELMKNEMWRETCKFSGIEKGGLENLVRRVWSIEEGCCKNILICVSFSMQGVIP